MKRVLVASTATLALAAGGAMAGGVDRSGQSVGIIFKEGSYAEFSFGSVAPEVSGTSVALLGARDSGDMAADYTQIGAGIKHGYSNGLDVALIFDQPYGANVEYPDATGYYAAGSDAELRSSAVTAVLKYSLNDNMSVYGGLRYQTLAADVVLGATGYTAEGERDGRTGYLLGAAYERPDIALRVALTYNSAIEHELDTTEVGVFESKTSVTTPQSLNLEFQSGVAANTLVFGSVRWVDWTEFDITPDFYFGQTGSSLVSYDDDTITYSLGLGRRFNENWSGAVTVGYEAATGGYASNLGPTDGNTSLGLGATYTQDNVEITGGVRFVKIGKAETQQAIDLGAGPVLFAPAGIFDDNTAMAFGLKVGYKF